jgi:hypothetical protein
VDDADGRRNAIQEGRRVKRERGKRREVNVGNEYELGKYASRRFE